MIGNPMDYIWDEVEAYQTLGEKIYDDIVSAPADAIRDIMEQLNDEVNGSYPIARDFMGRSIRGDGNVSHGPDSNIAAAISRSKEFSEIVADSASSTIGTVVRFRSDPNLSRSLHDCTLSGALEVSGQDYTFRGDLVDRYDFRYDWLPASWTWRGVGLRLAGNIAKACTDVGLMKPFEVKVELDFSGRK